MFKISKINKILGGILYGDKKINIEGPCSIKIGKENYYNYDRNIVLKNVSQLDIDEIIKTFIEKLKQQGFTFHNSDIETVYNDCAFKLYASIRNDVTKWINS